MSYDFIIINLSSHGLIMDSNVLPQLCTELWVQIIKYSVMEIKHDVFVRLFI